MSEQEMWDKFVEYYRRIWRGTTLRSAKDTTLFESVTPELHWAIFNRREYNLTVQDGGHDHPYAVQTCSRLDAAPLWSMFTEETWSNVQQLIPETTTIRILYV